MEAALRLVAPRSGAKSGSATPGPARDPARGGRGAIARRDVMPWPRAIGLQLRALWRGRRRLGSRRQGPGPRGGSPRGLGRREARAAERQPTDCRHLRFSAPPRGGKGVPRGSDVGSGSLRASDEWLPGIARAEKGNWLPKGEMGSSQGSTGGRSPRRKDEGWGFPRGEMGRSRGETLRAPGGPEGDGAWRSLRERDGGPRGGHLGPVPESPGGSAPPSVSFGREGPPSA